MRKILAALCAAAALLMPALCRADEIRAYVGGATFTGKHGDMVGKIQNSVIVALPMFAVRAEHKQLEFSLEDVPPIGPIAYTSPIVSDERMKIGYGDASLRYWFPKTHFAIGVGDSLYLRGSWNSYGAEATRAAGTRYEILDRAGIMPGVNMLASLAISPSMHQRFGEWNSLFVLPPPARPLDGGRASLVEGTLQLEMRAGHGHDWISGVRYLNYSGGRPGFWSPAQERTAVVAAYGAWGFALGR